MEKGRLIWSKIVHVVERLQHGSGHCRTIFCRNLRDFFLWESRLLTLFYVLSRYIRFVILITIHILKACCILVVKYPYPTKYPFVRYNPFVTKNQIIQRSFGGRGGGALGGELKLSLDKQLKQLIVVKRSVYHLGVFCRQFNDGNPTEDDVENCDEAHFIINMDTGRGLVFKGEDEIKWAVVVSGGDEITMVVRIYGGRDSMIQPAFIIFQYRHRAYFY